MLKRILVLVFGVGVPLVMIAVVFIGYSWVFDSNVSIEKPYALYVYPDENPRDVLDKLLVDEVVEDKASFIFVAQQKKWNTSKPGYYIIEPA
jgi:cell division protein YceG involved in septum cleavage